jgi:hypothetical protein
MKARMVHLGEARQQQGVWQTSELGDERTVRVKLVMAAHRFGKLWLPSSLVEYKNE